MVTTEANSGSTMTRRRFLRTAGLTATLAATGGLLQACSGQASAPAPSKPAETKPAETKPAAPAAQPASAPTQAAPAQGATTPAAGMPTENVSLSFWNGLTGPDGKILEGLLGEFQAKYPNIKIEHQQIMWNDLYTKMLTSIPAGGGPEMALMHT